LTLPVEVKIIRSRRRFRTVSASLTKDILLVQAPQILSAERLNKIIDKFKIKFENKLLKTDLDKTRDLVGCANRINMKYFDNKLKLDLIEYATDQNSKFGCCNWRTARIRISHKISLMPGWVRDYVVLHEMAHLVEPNHGKAFWDIVSRYRLTERARGYLMAAGRCR